MTPRRYLPRVHLLRAASMPSPAGLRFRYHAVKLEVLQEAGHELDASKEPSVRWEGTADSS